MIASLAAAIRLITQMPDDRLDIEVPNPPRNYQVLGHSASRRPFWRSRQGHR